MLRIILMPPRLVTALLVLCVTIPALLALAGFAVPVFDIFNHLQILLFFGTLLGALLALALRMGRVWVAVALMGFAASSWAFVPEWLSSLAPRQVISDATPVTVMTHNVFGLNYDIERVAKAINEVDPDIVALQEFFPEQQGLGQLLKARYPYSVRCQGGKRANLGLYSKLPFDTEMAARDCPTNARGGQRTAHIAVKFTLSTGTSFSVMTTHMDWPYPVERQRDQLAAAAEVVNNIAGPLVVVGDFNSTPWSYALRGFEAATGLKRETRNLVTFPELWTVRKGLIRMSPFLPLDHVFQRGVIVSDLRTGPQTGSDHLPVVFTFTVAP